MPIVLLADGGVPESAVHVVLHGAMPMMGRCVYCSKTGHMTKDHLIKRAAARRRAEAAFHRNDGDLIVTACHGCNVSIGTRCFVPPSHAHRIPELEKWTGQKYAVYEGPESLRQVVK